MDNKSLSSGFMSWIYGFIKKSEVDVSAHVYTDARSRRYTVLSYIRFLYNNPEYQQSAQEFMTTIYEKGGRSAVKNYIRNAVASICDARAQINA